MFMYQPQIKKATVATRVPKYADVKHTAINQRLSFALGKLSVSLGGANRLVLA